MLKKDVLLKDLRRRFKKAKGVRLFAGYPSGDAEDRVITMALDLRMVKIYYSAAREFWQAAIERESTAEMIAAEIPAMLGKSLDRGLTPRVLSAFGFGDGPLFGEKTTSSL